MRLIEHVRSQWMGALALFLVIAGGTAYAADTIGSDDIIDESIQSVDVKNGQVKTSDIGNNQVRSADVNNNEIQSADVKELSQFSEAASATGSCTDDPHIGQACAIANITLERPGKLLLYATSEWHTAVLDDTSGPGSDTDDPTWVTGTCQLFVDGTAVGSQQPVGERMSTTTQSNHPFGGTMSLTGLSGSVPAGSHNAFVRCNETDGDIDWSFMNLTAGLVAD